MKDSIFTPEELKELRKFDEELDDEDFELSDEELALAEELDKLAEKSGKSKQEIERQEELEGLARLNAIRLSRRYLNDNLIVKELRKQYRFRNLDKIRRDKRTSSKNHKDTRKRYLELHREEILAYKKKYREEHHEAILAYAKKYGQEHREHRIEYMKQWREERSTLCRL